MWTSYRSFVDDLIYRIEKIIIHLFFAEVHPTPGSRTVEGAKPRWMLAMWMRCR